MIVDPRAVRDGQRVRVTVTYEGIVQDADGDGRFTLDGGLTVTDPDRVTVETLDPDLPTVYGACLLGLVRGMSGPRLLTLRIDADDSLAWFLACSHAETIPDEDILPGWVEIDPATLRPVTETPERPTLPTGLGAVVRTRDGDGQEGYATLTQSPDDDGLPWVFTIPGRCDESDWLSGGEVEAGLIDVLQRGIEVTS